MCIRDSPRPEQELAHWRRAAGTGGYSEPEGAVAEPQQVYARGDAGGVDQ